MSSEAVEWWRRYEELSKEFEQAANRDPAAFAKSVFDYMAAVCQECHDYQDYLHNRFGVEYVGCVGVNEFRFRKSRVVDPNHAPRTRDERFLYEAARNELLKWGVFFDELLRAIDEAERNDANVERAMCEAFLRYWRSVPALYGTDMISGNSPLVKQAGTLALSGWLGSQIRLSSSKDPGSPTRTKRALDDEGVTLFEALPPATILSFPEMEPDEPLRPPGGRRKSLVSRVSDHIAKQGREATVKLGQIAEEPSDEAVVQDLLAIEEIEEFEARETARQQLGALEDWVEKAEFSKREAQVYELDMMTGRNTKAIAQKLQITDGQVRHHRKGYRDKLRTVRAAAVP